MFHYAKVSLPEAMLHSPRIHTSALSLPSPEWGSVRPIYKKLSDEFHILTDAHEVRIDPATRLMLDHLLLGIDSIDRVVDALPSRAARDDVTASIVGFLEGDGNSWNCSEEYQSLQQQVERIKHIVAISGISNRFTTAVKEIFDHTERKRHVRSFRALIDHVLVEGRYTAELPLSVMQTRPSHAFAIFFTRLCMLMGIADLIVDARRDYRMGYIVAKPGLRLYLALHVILIREGLRLLWCFPGRWKFLLYCTRFSWALLRSKS